MQNLESVELYFVFILLPNISVPAITNLGLPHYEDVSTVHICYYKDGITPL